MKSLKNLCLLLASVLTCSIALAQNATVLYNERVVELEETLADATDLWVKPEDLTRINDFVLKPEGACLDELCIPVLQDRDGEMFVRRQNQAWFNVTELADKLQQAYLSDYEDGIWSFGGLPLERTPFFESAVAPDFELPGRDGEIIRLSDFRGKKILLLTWASW